MNINLITKVLCLTLCICSTSTAEVFHIRLENSTASDCPDPCVTLDEYAQNFSTLPFKFVVLTFLPGVHELTLTLAVESKVNSTFKAASTHVSIQCSQQGSFHIENVDSLLVEGQSSPVLFDNYEQSQWSHVNIRQLSANE